ncbi:MAG: nucleotide exchange factor GrpE, partial [Patescibacteria group bacterium]
HRKAHFVFLDYFAHLAGGELAEMNEEMDENIWIKPEEALKTLEMNPYTKLLVEKFTKRREKHDFEHKYKRALADYQNLLKRTAEEKSECAKYASENLIQAILPVYDNLKLALMHSNGAKDGSDEKNSGKDGAGNGGQIEEGLKMVLRQFKNILEEEGVKEIETAGKPYDPHAMEAMGHTATNDKKMDGIVAEELKPGYRLKGKVIVPARVKVFEFKK